MKVRELLWDKRSDSLLPPYQTTVINCENGTEIQVTESPRGRSVQIHVLPARRGLKTRWRKVYP